MTNPTQAAIVATLQEGQRVRLHPTSDNPLHERPVEATYLGGYFWCDGTEREDGPDFYIGDVLRYNERVEVLS